MKQIGRLHVLTDTELQTRFSHPELARLAVAGGAEVIQYRQKTGSTREMIETAAAIQDLCRRAGVTFVVNDRLDVALAVHADGVHLGQQDFPIPGAREILGPEAIIGGTAKTVEQVRTCFREGADYVGYGPIFPTASKSDAGWVKGLENLKDIVENADGPIVAIGGIGPENASEVIRAGAHGLAVISAVCGRADPERAARDMILAIQAGREGNSYA